MNWIEITVRTNTAGADMVSEQLMRTGAHGTSIEDRNDAPTDDTGPAAWDELDPGVVDAMDQDVLVRGYLPQDARAPERVSALRQTLAGLDAARIGFDAGPLTVAVENVREEDWAENWKQYYKPFRVGERLVVKPVWEAFALRPDDLLIEIDPGMAFGNGTHETTAMCMALLERVLSSGDAVLDVGTGSGILAIAAARLGAQSVLAVDIDPVAVRVAQENIDRNGVGKTVTAQVGDLLAGVSLVADVVVANIIADVVIRLAGAVRTHLKPGGTFVCSGIIREREADVVQALVDAGFTVAETVREGEWVAIAAKGHENGGR